MACGIGIRRASSHLVKCLRKPLSPSNYSACSHPFWSADSTNHEHLETPAFSRNACSNISFFNSYLQNSNSSVSIFGHGESFLCRSFSSHALAGLHQQVESSETASNSASQEQIPGGSAATQHHPEINHNVESDPVDFPPQNNESSFEPEPSGSVSSLNNHMDSSQGDHMVHQGTAHESESHGDIDNHEHHEEIEEGEGPPQPFRNAQQQAEYKRMTEAKRAEEEKLIDLSKEKAATLGLRELNKEMSDYISHNKFMEAWCLFEAWARIPGNVPSVLSYNFALHAMMRNKEPSSKLMNFFSRMLGSNLEPNQLTYNSLLRSAFREKDSYLAEHLLKSMEKSSVAQPDSDAYNMLVTLCAINRRLAIAMIHLQTMLSKGFVPSRTTYNELLSGCSRIRRTRDATVILKAIHEQAITPVPTTLGELLTSAAEAEDPQCAILTLKFATQFRFVIDEGCLLLVLNLAARTGYSNLAELAWSVLESQNKGRDIFPPFHLARIHAYSSAGDLVSGFRSLREMEESLVKSNGLERYKTDFLCPFTHIRPLTLACNRSIGVLDMAYYKLAEMHANGEAVSLAAVNCVIAGCSALRDHERSQQTFDEISNTFSFTPDVHSYNALMDGYSKSGQAIVVEKLFREMKEKNIEPNSMTYTIYTDAHIMSHDAVKALSVLEEMIAAKHLPSQNLLVRMYKRAKRSRYEDGVLKVTKMMTDFGYRQSSGSESRKRALIMEGVNQSSFGLSNDISRPRPQPKRTSTWNMQQQAELQKQLLDEQW